MRDRIEKCTKILNQYITEYNMCKNQLKDAESKSMESLNRLKDLDEAIAIIQAAASTLQNNVKEKIVAIVQKALDATFPGMYFDMEFVTRRDKTECDLICTDAQGNRQSILDGCGGGLKQIVSFTLRIAVWSLDKTASDIMLLDEPMTFVSEGMRQQGADLITTLSKDLGIQFICVSHTDEIKNVGNAVYVIQKNSSGISKVMKNY